MSQNNQDYSLANQNVNYVGSGVNPGNNYTGSLAVPSIPSPGMYPTLTQRQTQGRGGSQLPSNVPDPALGGSNRPFFNPENSMMDNIGTIGNLATSGLGLVGMWKNLKAADLNYKNVEQQMDQSKEAFNRRKDAQDRTTAAIQAANNAAKGV